MWRSCMDRERDAQPYLAIPGTQAEVPDGEKRCHLGHPTQSILHTTGHLTTQCEETPRKNHPDDFTKLNYKR